MRSGHTLIELMVAMILFAVMAAGSMMAVTAAGTTISRDIDGTRLMTQINYALDNLRYYAAASSKVRETTRLPAGGGSMPSLIFRREIDLQNVTPGNLADDTWYRCYKNPAGNIALQQVSSQKEEVLVNAAFSPVITFRRLPGYEPNFFTVTITGKVGSQSGVRTLSKSAGIKLWYAEITQ